LAPELNVTKWYQSLHSKKLNYTCRYCVPVVSIDWLPKYWHLEDPLTPALLLPL
jgi:hypothetical protein